MMQYGNGNPLRDSYVDSWKVIGFLSSLYSMERWIEESKMNVSNSRIANLLWIPALVVSSVICAGEAEKTARIADILPDGTIMYAELSQWRNWSGDFSKTSLAKIFAEPEVRMFLAGPFSQISTLIRNATQGAPERVGAPQPPAPKPAAPEAGTVVSTFFNMMNEVARGPFAVAVRYSPEDAQAKRAPAVAAIIGVTAEANAEATKFWAGMLKNLLDNLNIKAVAVEEVRPDARVLAVKFAQADGSTLAFASTLYRGRIIITTDVSFCAQIIDGLSGTLAKKLTDTDSFKRTGLSGDEHLAAYLDVAGLEKAFGAVQHPADEPNHHDDFFVLSGLNKTISVAWSLKMAGPAFESRTAIFTKDARSGLLGTLAEEPLSDEAMKICPKGTPLALGFRMQPDRVMPFLRSAVKAIEGPKGLEQFDAVEKQLNAELGRNLEKEVRATFGNELVVTSLAGMEDAGPIGAVSAFAASLSVQDGKKADELLGQVLTRLAARMDPNGNAANVLKEVEHEGGKIRYLTPPRIAGVLEVSPAFSLQDKRLVVALDVPTLKRALRSLKSGTSLVDSENFKTSLNALGGKMGPMFSYVDWSFIYKAAFNLSTTTLKLIAPTDILREIGIDMNLLPSTETVAQHLFPGLSVAQITANGVVLTSRSPLPSVEVLSPPLAAVSAVFASFRPLIATEKK
jgi:hypothetical protein